MKDEIVAQPSLYVRIGELKFYSGMNKGVAEFWGGGNVRMALFDVINLCDGAQNTELSDKDIQVFKERIKEITATDNGIYAGNYSLKVGTKRSDIRNNITLQRIFDVIDWCDGRKNGILSSKDIELFKLGITPTKSDFVQDTPSNVFPTVINKPKKVSQISNPYYTGVKYEVETKNTFIYVKNLKTGRQFKIDLLKFTKNLPAKQAEGLIERISSLPGEVLEDIAVELSKPLESNPHVNNFAMGRYMGYTNKIEICAYIHNVDFLIYSLVHELGHAVDATAKQDIVANCNRAPKSNSRRILVPYTSLQSYTYRDTFWKEKIAFDKIFKDTSKLGTKFGASRAYASTNESEMFAECYALLMMGDCSSKDIILKYFPKTFNLAKKMLTEIHSKTDMERNNKY